MSKSNRRSTENVSSQDVFLKARRVRERYGVSHMWIERRQKDAGFPPPTFFGGMRFWRLCDLERWETDQKTSPKIRANAGPKSTTSAVS
jgi:predicted DNA-binding transcriptional regulator AlpA